MRSLLPSNLLEPITCIIMKMNCCILSQIIMVVTLLLSGQWTKAQDLELEEHWWQPNGTVNSIVKDGNTVYLGGNFTYIGPDEPYGAAINTSTGTPDFTYLNPNGTVNAAIPDGAGGWYIGGDFTQVGGQPRSRIAQLNSSGQLTAFGANQGFNGSVNSLLLNNGTLYVGGFFNSHGTVSNGHGVALDNGNGVPDLAYLTPNGPVNAVVSDGMGDGLSEGSSHKLEVKIVLVWQESMLMVLYILGIRIAMALFMPLH